MSGQLFTQYFLRDGIKATPHWKRSAAEPGAFTAFCETACRIHLAYGGAENLNEAVTEQEVVRPLLEALGWRDYLPQQGSSGNEDIPDHLLFADAETKTRAISQHEPRARFRSALVVQESKRLGLPLDVRDAADRASRNTPHGQILRYLETAHLASEGRIRWGMLTNGVVWRLYDHRARPRASGYYEADLGELTQPGREDELRAFHLLFCRDAFTPAADAAGTFLEDALAEGRRYEEQVARDLSTVVFERVFPRLVRALAEAAGDVAERGAAQPLSEVRRAALIFLYRLLFVLYAEDRGLLPVNDSRYDDYGLRKRVRDDVARRVADGDRFSSRASQYDDHLRNLFRLIDAGDPSIGLPPYNGGLFARGAAPLLETVRLPDDAVAAVVYDLSHRGAGGEHRFVNYRDMSVQQLGSIYERLLEHEPARGADGAITIRPNPYVRKDSGSFYTPQELVDLILDHTLKPLAEERLKAFEDKAAALQSDPRPKAQRRAELSGLDPAEAVLELKVLDPAMGSGHFLVSAVDFLSDTIAGLIEYAPAVPGWLDDYASPLTGRIERIRQDILERAREADWVIDAAQLTDQAIIRRMVLKRCIYGVDKNPLTVELAKVSLWLHSFTVGAPLSFLDHHLRAGDSLIGIRVHDARQELSELGGLAAVSAISGAEAATQGMQRIEAMSDADVSEVRESAALFDEVEHTTADLRGLLDFLRGWHWMTAGMRKKDLVPFRAPLIEALEADLHNAFHLLARGPGEGEHAPPAFRQLWRGARAIADREGFLHWEAAFPGVWQYWQNARPAGGFDAVIGNPPWDRIEQQENEWFATRDKELALAQTGAVRKRSIRQRIEEKEELALEYEAVRKRAAAMRSFFRSSNDYPLLSGGRVNLYSLFVERALSLVKPDGFVGLLTPSGIYADKTAAVFFKFVSTGGRVGGLFDFENRRLGTDLPPFFPDVDSRFKFCALIVGGETRRFDATRCAFFLHDTAEIGDPNRCFPLMPSDFARVNPNTGTAPVFRTKRDADITRRIYDEHPVLVDHSGGEARRVWPVRYMQGLFNMTSDSHLFRTVAQLHAEGFYPVQGNRWKRGEDLYVPLYEGKMVQAFDHRAASVVVNPENLNRPAQPREATGEEHADPNWLPDPQFWVPASECGWKAGTNWVLGFKEITAPTNAMTFIAALFPTVGFGNKVPIFRPTSANRDEWLLAANVNAMPFNFVTRQKIQGQTLNLFIVEQLPVIAPADYDRPFGDTTARDLVRDHVLRLTYTAHDMAPFARDLGYDGPPFTWDDEERRHLRARLDALYFHLYGLSRGDASYVLDTFPIVRRDDQKAFGRYRTRDLILAYMSALEAGDTETRVAR